MIPSCHTSGHRPLRFSITVCHSDQILIMGDIRHLLMFWFHPVCPVGTLLTWFCPIKWFLSCLSLYCCGPWICHHHLLPCFVIDKCPVDAVAPLAIASPIHKDNTQTHCVCIKLQTWCFHHCSGIFQPVEYPISLSDKCIRKQPSAAHPLPPITF